MSSLEFAQADQLRGHSFLPDDDVLAAIPPLYATENMDLADKVCHLHYFCGASDWYVMEVDADSLEGFGWTRLNGDTANAELGYINLPELRAMVAKAPVQYHENVGGQLVRRTGRMPVVIERDLHFEATRFGDLNL